MLAKFGVDHKSFTQGMRKAQNSTNYFQKQIMKLGPAIAAAFSVRSLNNFRQQALEAYNVQAQAETKLNTALGDNEAAFKRLTKLARDLQRVTVFGDEKTIEAMSFLAQLRMTEWEITKLIPLIQDFATAQNMDLGQAAKLVAKSVGSSTNAMSRYGIEIEGVAGSAERAESMAHKLNKMVGGQAAAAAQTGTASAQQLANAWSDFAEIIGEKAAPATNKFNETLTDMLNVTNEVIKSDKLKWWQKVVAFSIPHVSGMAVAGARQTRREYEDQFNKGDNVNMEVPQWWTDLQAQMKRDAELAAALAARNAANAFSTGLGRIAAPSSIDQSGPELLPEFRQTTIPQFVTDYQDAAQKLSNLNADISQSFKDMAGEMAMSLADGIGGLITGTESMGGLLKGLALQFTDFMSMIGRQMVQLGIAMEVFKKNLFNNPLGAVAAGLGVIALASTLRAMISNFGNTPELAEGGLAYGPTAAIVGDNPRANVDPEVIAPLSKLQGMLASGGQVEFIIAGDKLKGVLNRYDRRLSTIT